MASFTNAFPVHGPLRVAVDQGLIVVGGPDGVVQVYRTARWTAHAHPLWSNKIHDGAVTSIALCTAQGFAFTSGRDGHVYRHDVSATSDALNRSRVVCRVSGEIRVIALSDDRAHLFVAGDSIRYISLGERPYVTSIPSHLPPPLMSLVISPCGGLIAVASSSSADVVVSGVPAPSGGQLTQTQPSATTTTADGEGGGLAAAAGEGEGKKKVSTAAAFPYANVKFVLRGVVQKSWRKDEDRAFHMTWCRHTVDSASFLLALPSEEGARVLRFLPPDDPANKTGKPVLSNFYTVASVSLSAISGAWVYPRTNSDFTLALAGTQTTMAASEDEGHRETHSVYHVVRCVVKATKGSHTVESTTRCPAPIADAYADLHHGGHVVVATVAGEVGLLKGVIPHPRKPRSALEGSRGTTEATRVPEIGGGDAKPKGVDGVQPAQPPPEPIPKTKRLEDDEEVNSEEDEDDEESEAGSSEASSEEEGSSDDDRKAQRRKKHGAAAATAELPGPEEDLSGVVRDLMRSDHHVLRDGAKRRTALRSGTTGGDTGDHRASSGRGRVVPAFLDDEAEEGSSEDEDEEYDEDHEDDVGSRSSEEIPDHDQHADEQASQTESGGRHISRGRRHTATPPSATPPQTDRNYCFQPGATPMQELDGVSAACCYYAYNSIGWIRYHASEGTFVQFHDVSRASIKLNERGTVLMAALGIPGAAFVLDKRNTASAAGEGGGLDGGEEAAAAAVAQGQSHLALYFRTYVALGAQADWRVSLMDGESPRCVAVGLRFVALATNVALRLFSLSGLELAVLSLPTRIVCMVGCNSTRLGQTLRFDQDPLAVVYHSSGGSGLECVVFNCYSQSVMQTPRPVPVTHDETYGDHYLEWIGFSDDGPLHTCDSAGVVRMATNDWGGTAWLPVYDPRHFTSDPVYTLWVWGVSDSHLSVYRSARGAAHHYPAATSLPSASAAGMDHVRICLPLLRVGGEKQVLLRDRFLRSTHKVNELKRTSSHYTAVLAKQDALHDAHLMTQFKEALKEQLTSRAVDLATMFQLRESVEEAARHANQEGHKAVLLKLVAIIEARHKLKQKRLCSLPLEGSEVTDKERDQILRRLLVKEREAEAAAVGGNSSRPTPASTAPSSAGAPSVRIPSVLQKNAALDGNTLHLLERSPEEEAAQVAAAASGAHQTAKRRSVAFAVDEDSGTTTVLPTAAVTLPVVVPPKVVASTGKLVTTPVPVVPSKPTPPSFSGVKGSLTATTSAAVKPVTVSAKPAVPFGTTPSAAVPDNAKHHYAKPAVLGTAIDTTSATSTITPPKQQQGVAAEGTEPTTVVRKSTNTSAQQSVSSPPDRRVRAEAAVSSPRVSSVAKTFISSAAKPSVSLAAPPPPPSPFDEPPPAFLDLPVDPFLPQGEDGTKVGRRSALLDVGHHTVGLDEGSSMTASRRDLVATGEINSSFVGQSQQAVIPKTSSFGDALRKRYRDEEEEDGDDDDGSAASSKQKTFGGDSAPLQLSAIFNFQKP